MAKAIKNKETNSAENIEKSETNKKTNTSAKVKKVEVKSAQKAAPVSNTQAKPSKVLKAAVDSEKTEPKVAAAKVQNLKASAKKEDLVKTSAQTKTVDSIKSPMPAKSSKGAAKKTAVETQNLDLKVDVKTSVIVEPTPGAEPKIEVLSVLKPGNGNPPVYSLNEDLDSKKTYTAFHKIVAHDDIVKALNKAHYKEANENLQKILQSVLRGSDVFVNIPDFKDMFLIGSIGAAYKILSGALTRGEAKQPLVLILTNDEKKLNELFSQSTKVFSSLQVNLTLLSETASDEEKKSLSEKHIDVLFSTVKALENVQTSFNLNLSSVGLAFAYGLQDIAQNSITPFNDILKSLPQERVQKVFISSENSPKVRALAFSYLEDLEYFYLLPCYIKDRAPKQFGHALTVTQKFQVLLGHLKNHKPACAAVFANTRSAAEWIAYKLHGNGIKVELITTSLSCSKKQALIKAVKAGDVNVIVTTDYNCTNLGLEELNCLYQFDLPDSPDKFIDRLNLIEGSKLPISVSFICEDYGYNMGKIEDKLGFKIHINYPDKNYFNIKDESEYPLEADGRVKRIGSVGQQPQSAPVVTAITSTPVTSIPISVPSVPISIPVVEKPTIAYPKLQPRPADSPASTFVPKAAFVENKGQNKFESKPQQDKYVPKAPNKFDTKYQDKFIRRDDKAKEALDAARFAAQEKRGAPTNISQEKAPPKNILSLAVYIMQDALKSASQAAKQSIATNIEENMPLFSSMLSKVSFFKKEKDR